MAQIILTALSKDPAQRFQTARQFRDAIENVSALPSAAALESLPPALLPAAQPWRLQPLLLTGLVTFLVMVVVFYAFLTISKL